MCGVLYLHLTKPTTSNGYYITYRIYNKKYVIPYTYVILDKLDMKIFH